MAERDPTLPLQGGGGGDNPGGVEVRLAKLEAAMEHVQADLARLSNVPAEIARISERLTHLPTKDEMRSAIEVSDDRAGARMQRTFAIGGIIVTVIITLAVAAINYAFSLHH